MAKIFVGAVMLLIIAASGVVAFQAGLENAGEDITITNETWTPTAGSVTQLDDSGIDGAFYEANVSVYDATTTNELTRGVDYEWFAGNGTVKALVGGALDGDSSALITYSYQRTTATQRQLTGLLAQLPKVIGLAAPLFLLFLLFGFIK
jgi:hypothetical protein